MSNWLRNQNQKLYGKYKTVKREFKSTSFRLSWQGDTAVYEEVDDRDNIQNQSYMSPQKLVNHGGISDFKPDAPGEIKDDLTIYDRRSLGNTLQNIKKKKVDEIVNYFVKQDILAQQQKLSQEANPVESINSNTDGPK